MFIECVMDFVVWHEIYAIINVTRVSNPQNSVSIIYIFCLDSAEQCIK